MCACNTGYTGDGLRSCDPINSCDLVSVIVFSLHSESDMSCECRLLMEDVETMLTVFQLVLYKRSASVMIILLGMDTCVLQP